MLAAIVVAAMPTAWGSTEVGSNRPFGVGVHLGTFSGFTGKFYLDRKRVNAIDFGLGAGYGRAFYSNIHGYVTYHVHFPALASGDGVTIPWRVGVGGWINSGGYWAYPPFEGRGVLLGARAPIGLDFDLEDVPVQLYVEVAFNLSVVPGVLAGLDAGIGGRYYF